MKLQEMKKIPVKVAAEILGVSIPYIRMGLQRGTLNIGSAVKISTQYTYHITYELLKNYVGIERIKEYEEKKLKS